MPVFTKRWDDPADPSDGFRLLITRYRPRALPKADETWNAWIPELGPSVALHAAAYGKHGPAISWSLYRQRYLLEMKSQADKVQQLTDRVARGETITLLCSSACTVERRCHRSLLKELIESRARRS
jgi:uncharacterized protein YeaO (DUF488 family)